jgi:RNA polymerase sigma factor (sigma-70 family)
VNTAEFELTITRHHRALIRFAYYLGAAESWAEDCLHETVARLRETGAFIRYEYEDDATRIPRWLARALKNTILADRQRDQRREHLLRQAVKEGVSTNNLQMSVGGGDVEDGFGDGGELDVGGTVYGDTVLEREHEHRAYLDALGVALETELQSGRVAPEVVTGLRLVVAGGKSWKEAGAETGVSPEALRKRVTRAMPELRARVLEAVRSGDVAHDVVKGANRAPEAR